MFSGKMMRRTVRMIAWISTGSMVLASGCMMEMRDSAVGSIAGFVGDYISAILAPFLPA